MTQDTEKAECKRELEQETMDFLKSTDVLINFTVTVTVRVKQKLYQIFNSSQALC